MDSDVVELLVLAIGAALAFFLGTIAKHLPYLGTLMGVALLGVPVVEIVRYDPKLFHSDGSAGGLILLIAYGAIGLFSFTAGLFMLRIARKSLSGEEVSVGAIIHDNLVESGIVDADDAPDDPPVARRQPQGAGTARRLEDVVWLSHAARAKGMAAHGAAAAARGERVAIGGWSMSFVRQLAADGLSGPILEPRELTSDQLAKIGNGTGPLTLLLAGTPSTGNGEDVLLRQCASLPFPVQLQLHHSLEDPLLKSFVSPNVRTLVGKMGGPNDPITHRYVTETLASARRKAAAG